MPQVRDRIVAEFGMEPEIFDPDEAVAKGAALFGLKESLQDEVKEILAPTVPEAEGQGGQLDLDGRLRGSRSTEALDQLEQQLGFTLTGPVRELVNTRIVNVLSKSLGVVARDDANQEVVVYLLPRNGEVPMEQTQRLRHRRRRTRRASTSASWPASATAPTRSTARTSASATLNLPAGLPARSPIRVKFAINRDGRLIVTATDLTGGGSIDVEFETEAVMNAEEVAERSSALRLLNVS